MNGSRTPDRASAAVTSWFGVNEWPLKNESWSKPEPRVIFGRREQREGVFVFLPRTVEEEGCVCRFLYLRV